MAKLPYLVAATPNDPAFNFSLYEKRSNVPHEGAKGIPVFLIMSLTCFFVLDKLIPCPSINKGLFDDFSNFKKFFLKLIFFSFF